MRGDGPPAGRGPVPGRRTAACALALAVAAGCSPTLLTRPGGDGGWSAERRSLELARRAAAGFVPADGAATAPPPAPAGPLSLPEAIALTRGANRRILEAEQRVDAAAARVRDARGRLLPDVTGSGRYTAYTDPQRVQTQLPAALLPAGAPDSFLIREQRVGQVNGTLTVPVDWTGELVQGLRAAQAGYRGERARLWATTLAEQVAAVRGYFQLLQAEALREVTRQTLAFQRAQLANAEQRFTSGRLTKNEVLVVQVRLANVEQEARRRDLGVDQARWSLNQVIGRAVDAPTTLLDVRTRPDLPDADSALHEAFAHNPVLVALLEQQQRLDATLAALERGWLPRVAGGGAIDWTSQQISIPQEFGSGFVGFTWDLGTDGRRAAQIAEAQSEVRRSKLALEGELRELETAVRGTQRATGERLAALDAAQAAVGQAEENVRIRTQQFDAGRATSEDVLDAEALLAEQRAVLATALYQAHTRRAELQQLIGLPVEPLAAATGAPAGSETR